MLTLIIPHITSTITTTDYMLIYVNETYALKQWDSNARTWNNTAMVVNSTLLGNTLSPVVDSETGKNQFVIPFHPYWYQSTSKQFQVVNWTIILSPFPFLSPIFLFCRKPILRISKFILCWVLQFWGHYLGRFTAFF